MVSTSDTKNPSKSDEDLFFHNFVFSGGIENLDPSQRKLHRDVILEKILKDVDSYASDDPKTIVAAGVDISDGKLKVRSNTMSL